MRTHQRQRDTADFSVGTGRRHQNPPTKPGAGSPTHQRFRLGDTDKNVGAGKRRFNPRGM